MESCDSSPNYMRATTSSDAKKDNNNSPGGSECDDIISITSSTCGSSVNNTGIKYRTYNKKTIKNVRSFRRRAKSRIIQPSFEISDESEASANNPKTRSCSESSSHSPQPNAPYPRTSSNRNVRILIKRASFKPKRSLLSHSQLSSEKVSVNRPTYSSTLRDSKFPEAKVLNPEVLPEKKICRYHHCSLHGHCHEPTKRFLHKRRLSLKKQKSMIPRKESKPETDRFIEKPKVLPKSQKGYEPENKKGTESYVEKSTFETDFLEMAFGETSFPERSYQESLDIMRDYSENLVYGYCLKCSCSLREQFDTTSTEKSAYSNPTAFLESDVEESVVFNEESCENQDFDYEYSPKTPVILDEFTSTEKSAFANSTAFLESAVEDKVVFNEESCENEGFDKEYSPRTPVILDEVTSTEKSAYANSRAFLESAIEETVELNCENEGFDKGYSPKTPVILDEVTRKQGAFSSASESQVSSGSNSELEGDFATASVESEASNITQIEESEPTREVSKLQFSKPRHLSMWNLIHQHMSSSEAVKKPKAASDYENQDFSVQSKESSDSDKCAEKNEPENQELEIRKLFAIKLVREAIEKILLPEVQDQTSDDQSITSTASTPRLVESEQSIACIRESNVEDDADKQDENTSEFPKEESLITNDASSTEIAKNEEKIVRKAEKKAAPKHWSNLKKWILLQRFIRELEKVRKFNPRKPKHLPLTPDPKAEKVNLRPQTLDERKSAEEWMLDYALRQAVGQLAPTQKRKVALLVKAFETVVPPPQEDNQIQFRIPRLIKDMDISLEDGKDKEEGPLSVRAKIASFSRVSSLEAKVEEIGNKSIEKSENLNNVSVEISPAEVLKESESGKSEKNESGFNLDSRSCSKLEKTTSDVKEREGNNNLGGLKGLLEDGKSEANEREKHIKMWHMIYQNVVSGIADKVGKQLLDGAEDEESADFPSEENQDSSFRKSAFTKSDALKLVKDAVDEIMLPETQDDSSDTQSNTNLNNWSKLKKFLVLKRSIRALEEARKGKAQPESLLSQISASEAEKVELRHEMMSERNKAEQWMLDYAVQHIVTKLTPARKRRVSMLVEAFEAVVPFPEI